MSVQTIAPSKTILRLENDILLLDIQGSLSVEDARAFIHSVNEMIAAHGAFFVLADLRRMVGITPESRREIGEWARTSKPVGASACIGGSLGVRTFGSLVTRAVNLAGYANARIIFVETEKEARDWLAEQRRQF
jgi:hypothetical protein